MPDIDVGANTFHYAEDRTGSRAIQISVRGQARGIQTYKFRPDPHADPWYNNNQATFYRDAATEIGTLFNANGKFPRYGTKSITVNNIEYELIES